MLDTAEHDAAMLFVFKSLRIPVKNTLKKKFFDYFIIFFFAKESALCSFEELEQAGRKIVERISFLNSLHKLHSISDLDRNTSKSSKSK